MIKIKSDFLKIIALFFSFIALETFDGFGISIWTIKVLRLSLGLMIIVLLSQQLTN